MDNEYNLLDIIKRHGFYAEKTDIINDNGEYRVEYESILKEDNKVTKLIVIFKSKDNYNNMYIIDHKNNIVLNKSIDTSTKLWKQNYVIEDVGNKYYDNENKININRKSIPISYIDKLFKNLNKMELHKLL